MEELGLVLPEGFEANEFPASERLLIDFLFFTVLKDILPRNGWSVLAT